MPTLSELFDADVRKIVRDELARERRADTNLHGSEVVKLRRLLRAACSTLESQHVTPAMWSGELVAWRRDDKQTEELTRTSALATAYMNGEVDPTK
jgi:hypothetical protein